MQVAGTRLPKWLVFGYVLSLCAIFAWPCIALTSPMAFDDPASHFAAAPYLYVACAFLYPLFPLGGVVGSLIAYRKGRRGLAYSLAAIALAPTVTIALWFALLTILNVVTVFRALS